MSRVAGRIRALNFYRTVIFGRGTAAAPHPTVVRSGLYRGSKGRDGSGVADVPAGPSLRGNGEHDDTQRQDRQSHELEYQCINHNNSPTKTIDLVGSD
jgi:hypothetical protein